MSRLSSTQLCATAEHIRRLHVRYTRPPLEGDVSRVLCGYLAGKFALPSRELAQSYVDHLGTKREGRIDFLLGNESSGTYIELAILREGDRWSFKPKYASDLWKLERAGGVQSKRVQLLVDLRADGALTKEFLTQQYRSGWKTTRGKYKRHHVTIVYAGSQGAYSFSLKPKALQL